VNVFKDNSRVVDELRKRERASNERLLKVSFVGQLCGTTWGKGEDQVRGAQFLSASGPMRLEFVVQLQLLGIALFMLIGYEN
jgi:hypothetical protein